MKENLPKEQSRTEQNEKPKPNSQKLPGQGTFKLKNGKLENVVGTKSWLFMASLKRISS